MTQIEQPTLNEEKSRLKERKKELINQFTGFPKILHVDL